MDVQVCMNLHLRGGLQNRWRDTDEVGKESASQPYREDSEQNTDNKSL